MENHRIVVVLAGITFPVALLATGEHAKPQAASGPEAKPAPLNLALYAKPSTSYVSGHESLDALNDGFEPRDAGDHTHGAYGNWPRTGTQWVQYDWPKPLCRWHALRIRPDADWRLMNARMTMFVSRMSR